VIRKRAGEILRINFELPDWMARPHHGSKCPNDKGICRLLESRVERTRWKGPNSLEWPVKRRRLEPIYQLLNGYYLSRGQSRRPHSSGDPDLGTSLILHSPRQRGPPRRSLENVALSV